MARKLYDEHGNEVVVKKKRGGCLRSIGIALLVIMVIGYFASEKSSTLSDPTPGNSSVVESSKPTEEVKEDDGVPQEYKNALKKAENYAKRMYMSKAGVYDQLVSEYGENFPPEAAQYAIDNLTDIDWNANALKKARDYFERMSMSKNDVYDQLISEYGEQFTPEQAQYAVDNLE